LELPPRWKNSFNRPLATANSFRNAPETKLTNYKFLTAACVWNKTANANLSPALVVGFFYSGF
jgi:hypothetical protein